MEELKAQWIQYLAGIPHPTLGAWQLPARKSNVKISQFICDYSNNMGT